LRSPARRATLRRLSRRDWLRLALLGLVFYTATQGLMFVGLAYLQANTLSLMLNLTSVVVAALGIFWLRELPAPLQWAGVAVSLVGVVVYFTPLSAVEPVVGLIVGGITVIANAVSALLGREINRTGAFDALTVTLVSMGVGSITLLALGITIQGLPRIDLTGWLIVGWLAVVNSALAFTLWNHTQRTLSATQSSIINSTMLIQIAVLAWLFLGETPTLREATGLALALLGTLLVQVRGRRPQE
jgi:drug/metabolite transporter (DMT)-like permease